MANSEYNLTVVDGTALTISLSGPVGPAGAGGGGATPAGNAGSVQYSNGTALVADSGLVYTGTGNSGKLTVGGGVINMSTNDTASQNVSVGGGNPNLAFSAITTGDFNVSFGTGNLQSITTGSSNVVMGTTIAPYLTEGYQNFGLGSNTLFNLTLGHSNVAIGHGAGGNLTTGSENILIGKTTGSAVGTDGTQIVIAGTSDGPRSTVIGFDGRLNELPTQTTRFIGNTITWGDGVVGGQNSTASPNNRTSLVQSASTTAKTITLPNANGTVPVYTVAPAAGQVLTSSGTNGAATWVTSTSANTANTLVLRDATGRAVFSNVGVYDLDGSSTSYIAVSDLAYSFGSNIELNPSERALTFLSGSAGATANTYAFPNTSGTVALTNQPQNFTAAQVFSSPSVSLSAIPIYASNGAANVLADGSIYRTSTGELRVKYT